MLSDLLLPPALEVGDLVCIAGTLEVVDMAASTQWLECQDCRCEKVVEGRCKSCGGSKVENAQIHIYTQTQIHDYTQIHFLSRWRRRSSLCLGLARLGLNSPRRGPPLSYLISKLLLLMAETTGTLLNLLSAQAGLSENSTM